METLDGFLQMFWLVAGGLSVGSLGTMYVLCRGSKVAS